MAPLSPLPEMANETDEHLEGSGDSGDMQEEIDQLLKDAVLNDTENVKKIAERFNLTQYEQILCIGVKYVITCAEEEGCHNESSTFNCSAGYNSKQIWLSFDPDTTPGKYLFRYAEQNWEVLGLSWQGACNLSEGAYLTLNINIPSLTPLLCGVDAEKCIDSSLRELTKQVSLNIKRTS